MEQKNQEVIQEEAKKTKSLVDVLYSKLSQVLDNYLEKNSEKIDSNQIYGFVKKAREFYKSLPENKQKSFTFILTSLIVFILASLIFFNISWGYKITTYWIAFVALNQVQAIASIITTITEIVILFTLVFLPERLKKTIAGFAKNIVILILSIVLGWIIAPVYIAYRLVLIFVDSPNSNEPLSKSDSTSNNAIDEDSNKIKKS
ncbi:MAG: hypothetical protein KDE33_17075 [Bacteroidetes bacterium]|nr:hypothetical protein [Bacteroidota bacterium]